MKARWIKNAGVHSLTTNTNIYFITKDSKEGTYELMNYNKVMKAWIEPHTKHKRLMDAKYHVEGNIEGWLE